MLSRAQKWEALGADEGRHSTKKGSLKLSHCLRPMRVQGESGGLGLGYVDINSVSFGGYPETELSQHNPVRDHQNHPVEEGVDR